MADHIEDGSERIEAPAPSGSLADAVAAPAAPAPHRRTILKFGAGLAALATAPSLFPRPAIAQGRTIRIGSYGGYFEDSFKKHVYPAFTEATGIEVQSVTQPNSADWLITMQQAASSGTVPTDLSLYGKATMIKAQRLGGLIKALDPAAIKNLENLEESFVFDTDKGLLGVGAMSWFVSMVVNPDEVKKPESWAEFWDSETFEQSLGIDRKFNSLFLDITAATFFDGAKTLETEEGILSVIEKVAELKPNVALWWDAESQMEQAMKNKDVIGGTYYHDVAGLMAADGFPIASIFPKEGNPVDFGSWCLSEQSDKTEEAQEFINYSCDPATQALMSRKIGTAPLVAKDKLDLTEEEFAAVSGSPKIIPAYEAYLDRETFISENWNRMLAAS